MKTLLTALLSAALSLACAQATSIPSTIDPVNKYAYGANIGWMDWRGDVSSGAVIGEFICFGYIYSANVGWISLGNSVPTNGIQYKNLDASDFGVNHDGFGNLRGFAYGANIGWVNFENAGAPRVDLKTGNFSGYAYSANCGWISLSNTFAHVQTDTIAPGADTDLDGLPDAWERLNFPGLGLATDPTVDSDGDGMNNLQEYLAGTDPNDPSSVLYVTSVNAPSPGFSVNLTWTSVSNRCYYVQETLNLSGLPLWYDSGLGAIAPDGLTTTRLVANTNAPFRLYRVQAFRPLGP